MNKGKTHFKKGNQIGFKLGYTPWNKNTNGVSSGPKGIIPWNKDKKGIYSEKTLELMSLNRIGEKSYQYKKDRTQLIQNEKKHLDSRYKEWMLGVKKRDNWKCAINNKDCNGKLEAHHILSWKENKDLRYDIKNGITLCHFHHPRGKKNEIQMSPYFKELIIYKNGKS